MTFSMAEVYIRVMALVDPKLKNLEEKDEENRKGSPDARSSCNLNGQ